MRRMKLRWMRTFSTVVRSAGTVSSQTSSGTGKSRTVRPRNPSPPLTFVAPVNWALTMRSTTTVQFLRKLLPRKSGPTQAPSVPVRGTNRTPSRTQLRKLTPCSEHRMNVTWRSTQPSVAWSKLQSSNLMSAGAPRGARLHGRPA